MPGQNAFLSQVTSRGADIFRAVSLCFRFIHKQRPTVITPSFKYQRPPLKSSGYKCWPLVRPHGFSRKAPPQGGNFYSTLALRFFFFPAFLYAALHAEYVQTYGADFLPLPQHCSEHSSPLKGAFRCRMPTSPS